MKSIQSVMENTKFFLSIVYHTDSLLQVLDMKDTHNIEMKVTPKTTKTQSVNTLKRCRGRKLRIDLLVKRYLSTRLLWVNND